MNSTTKELATEAMKLAEEVYDKNAVSIQGGKKYSKVVHRLEAFRRTVGYDYGIETEVSQFGGGYLCKALIKNDAGRIIGTANSYSTAISAQKALEKLETTAIGRALANLGLGGDEFASIDETESSEERYSAPKVEEKPIFTREDKITQVDLIDSIANITTPEGIDKWHAHYAETIEKLPKEFQTTIEAQLDNRLAQLENGVEPPARFYRHIDVDHALDYFNRFMGAIPIMTEKAIVTRQSTEEAKIASLATMLKAEKYKVTGEPPEIRLRKAMNDRVMELKGVK